VAAAERLVQGNLAYKCFCSKEDLDAKREAALAAKLPLGYDRTCRNLTAEQVAEKEAAGLPWVVRFKVPDRQGSFGYDDKVLGRIECDYREVDDFVILRSNGKPLYLLSNVVDDIRDRITHIIRGQDHMTNTTRQVLLYEALQAPLPVFAHIPLTLDTKKSKISKRSHGEIVAVHFYRDHGFIPWAFNNYLVLLGWSPGNDQEIFSREELIEAFTLERINKSSAIFNFRRDDPKFFTDPKAIAINAHYLRTMAIEELAPMVRRELEAAGLWDAAYAGEKQAVVPHTLELIRDRFHTLKDFTTLGRAYFADDFAVEEKPLQKNVLKFPELKDLAADPRRPLRTAGRVHHRRDRKGGAGTRRGTRHQAGGPDQCHAHRGDRPAGGTLDVRYPHGHRQGETWCGGCAGWPVSFPPPPDPFHFLHRFVYSHGNQRKTRRQTRRFHQADHRRGSQIRQTQRHCHPLSSRTQRFSPHRSRQVDLPQLRHRPREQRRLPSAISTTPTRARRRSPMSNRSNAMCDGWVSTGTTSSSTPPTISPPSTTMRWT
jgi:glutamyl-tRNA synthetase